MRRTRADGSWPAVLAAFSLGAALIHAAVVAQHGGALGWLFAATAAAQGTWALVVLVRPRRDVLIVGLVLNACAVGAYLLSRTVGLGSLESVEPFGTADLICAGLESAIVVSTVYLLSPRSLLPSYRRIGPIAAGVVVVMVVMISVPGLVATASGHSHAAGGAHDAGSHDAGASAAAGVHDHDVVGQSSFSREAQRQADALVADTQRDARRWLDADQAEADGFHYIGDGPFLHYINWKGIDQPGTLDPRRPEALVYAARPDGTRKLIAAMYVTPWGTSMDQVPAVQGAHWHDHGKLCFDAELKLVGDLASDGVCRPAGTLKIFPPMLHVAIGRNRCGPFGNLEQSEDPVAKNAVARLAQAGITLPTNDASTACATTHHHES
jgi:hypothetical protein